MSYIHVDVLIGTDHYYDFVEPAGVLRSSHGPIFIASKLGFLTAGTMSCVGGSAADSTLTMLIAPSTSGGSVTSQAYEAYKDSCSNVELSRASISHARETCENIRVVSVMGETTKQKKTDHYRQGMMCSDASEHEDQCKQVACFSNVDVVTPVTKGVHSSDGCSKASRQIRSLDCPAFELSILAKCVQGPNGSLVVPR